MFKRFLFIVFLTSYPAVYSQIVNFEEKFELPQEVSETSGLIFFNGKIITHNDSGDDPKLYELDSIHGSIQRTITIVNATHIDWEDITQNDTHIFIGDIGNNLGNRRDLRIYKIDKTDFLNSDTVQAEIIDFNFEDQTVFEENLNNHDFDAEALTFYDNQLLLFTKNWISEGTKAYQIPTTAGNHVGKKVSELEANGLITGVSYNHGDDSFMFCGYLKNLTPFLIFVSKHRDAGLDIFASGVTEIDLSNDLEQGSQIEGISFFDGSRYYLSRELFSATVQGMTVSFPQKLYEFKSAFFASLASIDYDLKKSLVLFPNPVSKKLEIVNHTNQVIKGFAICDTKGKALLRTQSLEEIDWKLINTGVLYVKIYFESGIAITKKILRSD